MKIGYARVSTAEQELDAQIEQLEKAGCDKIYHEKISGAKRERPQLSELLGYIRKGDVLVVCKLDRLARSTAHLLDIVEILKARDAQLCSLGEPWADTTSHAGKMIMTIFAGIAEFEKDLIRERTQVGRKRALNAGVKFGRPKKLNDTQHAMLIKMRQEGRPMSELVEVFKIDRSSIYRILANVE